MTDTLNKILKELESQERYEECAETRDKIEAMKTGDAIKYTQLAFDREGLIEIGFCKPGATWVDVHDRAVQFFGLANIFEYETMNGDLIGKRNFAIVKAEA